MDDDIKKTAASSPQEPLFNPFFALDLGERWGRELGSIDSRLNRVENDIQVVDAKIERLDIKIEGLDAKIDAVDEKLTAKIDAGDEKLTAKIDAVDRRVDDCLVIINRIDERTKNLTIIGGGLLIALIAGIVLHYLT